MGAPIVAGITSLIAAAPTPQELADKISLDSSILSEQFYYLTVVVMWLIHVGFMSYEAGVARRKNVMATAMKNILTIAVVTPTFYYFGWWIYGCFERGLHPDRHDRRLLVGGSYRPRRPSARRRTRGATTWARTSPTTSPVSSGRRSCCSPGRPRRSCPARSSSAHALSAYLDPRLHSRLGDLDPRRLVGLERRRLAQHAVGLPRLDRLGRGTRRRRRFHARCAAQARSRIGKYTKDGLPRSFKPHNLHLTLMGLMLIFTGFYAFYAACLVIQSTTFPGWANIYLNPTTLVLDHVRDHDRLRRRLHRRVFRKSRRPVLDAVRWPRRGDLGLGRRRRLRAVARISDRDLWRCPGRLRRQLHREEAPRRRRRRVPSPFTASAASWARWRSVSSRPAIRRGSNNVDSSLAASSTG